jgi:hypothetical protein
MLNDILQEGPDLEEERAYKVTTNMYKLSLDFVILSTSAATSSKNEGNEGTDDKHLTEQEVMSVDHSSALLDLSLPLLSTSLLDENENLD